jgi:hypothetical protein
MVQSPVRWPKSLTISPTSGEDSEEAGEKVGGSWAPFVAEEPNDLADKRRGFGMRRPSPNPLPCSGLTG